MTAIARPGPCPYCDHNRDKGEAAQCDGFVVPGALPHLLYGHCDVLRTMWDAGHEVGHAAGESQDVAELWRQITRLTSERDTAHRALGKAQAMITRLELELEDARDRAPTSPRRAIQ